MVSVATKVSAIASAVLLLLLLVVLCVVLMEKQASTIGNLKGSIPKNNTLDLSDYSASRKSLGICLVSMIEIEIDRNETRSDEEDDDDIMLICNRVSGTYNSGISDSLLYLTNVDREIIVANQKAMLNHEWFIEYSQEWIQAEQSRQSIVATIHVPEDHIVRTIEPSSVSLHPSIAPHHQRRLTVKLEERRRRLQVTVGIRTVVVVAVSYTDDLSVLHNYVFGPTNSLVSQMQECSQGQLFIQPHLVYPIIQVSPPRDVSEYTFVDLYAAVLDDIKEQLGLSNGQEITDTTDHLLLMVPDNMQRAPGELGWGATPGFFAGIIHSLAPSTMTMLHELGHNYGLGHAFENDIAYADMSTVMGYSHRNIVKMCYNGQNMWDMGWFVDRRVGVQLDTTDKDAQQVLNLAFYGDYSMTTSAQPVILRIGDLYLTYNRQAKMNLETKEYANMLLVVQEMPGPYHSSTNLDAAMDVSTGAYAVDNDGAEKVFIEVCSGTAGDGISTPDMLTVAIGWRSNDLCVGYQQSISRVEQAAQAQKPLECKTMWPWVEIPDEESQSGRNYVLCEIVASNPDRFCGETDDLSKDQVWKICRMQCPQSGCVEAPTIVVSEETSNPKEDGCHDVFSWVEVAFGNGHYISKTCDELGTGFKQDREYFCNLQDTLTRAPVRDVCQINCPNSGCSR